MQWRFLTRRGVRAARLLEHKRFRAAYDFLLLRSRCGEVDKETADWWTELQTLSPADLHEALDLGQRRGRRRRRGGRRRGRASGTVSDVAL